MFRRSADSHNKTFGICIVAIALLLVITSASADEYHYDSLLIGDRASGLGGAYVAIADDPAGLFYNPAGIVYTRGSNVSGSMNAYHATSITYKNALGGRYDWKRESSALLPNFFGAFQSVGKYKVGFSYAVVDASQENQDQTFTQVSSAVDKYIVNYNNQDTTYNIGPSFAMELSQNLAFGITLYGHIRKQELIFNQAIFGTYDSDPGPGVTLTNDSRWENSYSQLEEFGIRPIIGLLWSPKDNVSLGLSISHVSVLSSTQKEQQICWYGQNPGQPSDAVCQSSLLIRTLSSESDARAKYPWKVRMGAAYFPTDSLLFSGDLIYHSSTSDGKVSVLNIAFGTEYYLNSQWAIRVGVFSNNANTSKVKSTQVNQAEHVDLLGGSFSVTRFSRNSALTLGFSYSKGSGKAQLFSGLTETQETDIEDMTLFLSASYNY